MCVGGAWPAGPGCTQGCVQRCGRVNNMGDPEASDYSALVSDESALGFLVHLKLVPAF